MTKYVVQSGGLKSQPDAARAYFAELLEGLGNSPRLLWCFFATLPDDCDDRFKHYTKLFESFMPDGIKPININATVDNFEKEVANADAIYMHGGNIKPLRDVLEKYDITKLFANKSVGTNSASSMVLAKYAWSCDERVSTEELGILPIKVLAHFESSYGSDDPRGSINWDEAFKQLSSFGDVSLPIHALREGRFIVMEK